MSSPKRKKHDILFKDVFSHKAMVASFVRTFVDESLARHLRLDTLERLSGEFVTQDGGLGFSDMVWRLRRHGGRWCYVILLLEFQSTSDRMMAIRLLSYISLLLLRLERERKKQRRKVRPLPLVLPIVIYNGEKPWSVPLDTLPLFGEAPSAFLECLPALHYLLVDVRRLALANPELCDSLAAQWLRYNRAENPEERATAITELARILRTAEYKELDELKRTLITWFAHSLKEERVPGAWRELFETNNFEEIAMRYAEGYMQWEKRVHAKGRAEGRAEGHAAGRAEGHAAGRAEGSLNTQKENLREYLEDRFGKTPQVVQDFLLKETDMTVLRGLTKAAWQVVSLEDFLALLDKAQRDKTH